VSENPSAAEFDFEAAIRELETLVGQLERGDLALDAALTAYQRGSQLLIACRGRLEAVRQQVQIVDGEVLRAFDGGDNA
jgi:exodeoxyribonuclease VII small subunit